MVRVLSPGGTIAVTVPRWLPEKVCWALSDAYHEVEGGHVRIYTGRRAGRQARERRLVLRRPATTRTGCTRRTGGSSARSASTNDEHPLVQAYHRLLVWDIMKKPLATRLAERALNPLIGKSLVLYLRKPEAVA